ncbi:tripartite tricarboxylate transporter permease [Marinomonas sp. TW1]|uniref:tripartite tricarboxylate transporter permease n=1 Tax=Marinomonas sp. TW1 TaxID=1561203 RepID=UPI000A47A9F2|nr:tripartite tricarboxylate transporter permease [Marinomonas sp. TW1]
MEIMASFGVFGNTLLTLLSSPTNLLILMGASFCGIIFGALPGLTATLGVALLTTLTYGMDVSTALIALLGLYVGAIYGGSYPSILINIPGTAAAAATALDGFPLAQKGEGGRALGLTTTASLIGTFLGILVLVVAAPMVAKMALQFTSFEFFLLALFGIIISGTLTSSDLVIKGWIAGLIGLGLSTIGRDPLQFFPRFTFDMPDLDQGLEVVPVLIGAFGIPQVIKALRNKESLGVMKQFGRILPEWKTLFKNRTNITRSSMIGIGIGAVPGIGEDIAGWVSYGAAKNTSKHPETFGTGEPQGIIASETANNACIGGALIPLLTLGIPGSPPAAMLLGALMLHGITPGPMIVIESPDFLIEVTAILILCSVAMWLNGMFLAKQVVKVLQIPASIFLPVVTLMCILGSYALGLNIFNLYLMVIVGVFAYFLDEMKYPISPLVIGVILGPMADENLRRALMVSEGSLMPFIERPISIALISVIVLIVMTKMPFYQSCKKSLISLFKK